MVAGRPRPPNSASCSNGAAQNHGPPPITTEPAALTAASAPIVMPVRRDRRCRADAALEVDGGGAEAGADAAERELGGGGCGRRIAEVAIGREAAPVLVAAGQQVEQDRARHDRHPGGAHRKAAAALAQPGLDAAAGFEPEGRAARQARCRRCARPSSAGSSRSVSRVPGPPPRTSMLATAGSSNTIAVTPEPSRASCGVADQDAGDIGDEVACGHRIASAVGSSLAQAGAVIARNHSNISDHIGAMALRAACIGRGRRRM